MRRYLQVRRGAVIALLSTFIVLLALVAPVPLLTVHFGPAGTFWVRTLDNLLPGMGDLVWYVLVG